MVFYLEKFWQNDDLKKILKLMGPMVIAASSAQINVLVNTNFATSLEPGAVSWLNFFLSITTTTHRNFCGSHKYCCFTKANKSSTKKCE